jgi:hypothetical protein
VPIEELGTLERVEPSSLWNHEAHDFTPWLLANAEGLADALGIDLELEEAEHRVGAFALDLVGRDATNDTILMVENQLAGTDHSHLGQILTYAAGTGASTINEWQKVVREAAQGQKESGKSPLYIKFWERLLVRIAEEEPTWTRRRPGTTTIPSNWIDMPSSIPGASFNFSFARGRRLCRREPARGVHCLVHRQRRAFAERPGAGGPSCGLVEGSQLASDSFAERHRELVIPESPAFLCSLDRISQQRRGLRPCPPTGEPTG